MTRYFAKDPTELGLSVSAMVWRENEILLMRRSDNGLWGLPGGFVELGESVSEAARREVAEETGWSVEIGRLIGVYSDPVHQVVDYGSQRSGPAGLAQSAPGSGAGAQGDLESGAERRIQVVNLCFHATALTQGEPSTPEETLEVGFFPVEALPGPFVPIHEIRIEDGLGGSEAACVR